MASIVWFGDLVAQSGFGRIGNEVCTRLVQRGHQVIGLSLYYSGWPPHSLPFYVYPLAGKDIWNESTAIINSVEADLVICTQDFPYSVSLYRDCPIDWSRKKFMFITPIDGIPIASDWLACARLAQGGMVISEFGVEALRQEGIAIDLLPPGVSNEFNPPKDDNEKVRLKLAAGFPENAYVVGMFAMNQGRKNIPATVQAFKEFSKDKDNAFLYLDMEQTSIGGWDIPEQLLRPIGVPRERVKFRADVATSVPSIRERYLLCDVHSVISFREGFGLPILEAMACGVPSFALDWCSGTELVGKNMERGYLVQKQEYMTYGTWGGAMDAHPVMSHYIDGLNKLYYDKPLRDYMSSEGVKWAKERTWDKATDAAETVIRRILKNDPPTANSIPNNPSVQQLAGPYQVYSMGIPSSTTDSDGSDTVGRSIDGVQSPGDIPEQSTVQGLKEPKKPRVRREL